MISERERESTFIFFHLNESSKGGNNLSEILLTHWVFEWLREKQSKFLLHSKRVEEVNEWKQIRMNID